MSATKQEATSECRNCHRVIHFDSPPDLVPYWFHPYDGNTIWCWSGEDTSPQTWGQRAEPVGEL